MEYLTRREFLNTAAGAAVGAAVVGHAAFLEAAVPDNSAMPADSFESSIFPRPREVSRSDDDFLLDNQVRIVVPLVASQQELYLARLLANELGDRFDLHLKTMRADGLIAGRVILMGSIRNPLIQQQCARMGLDVSTQMPGPEGYILRSNKDLVLVAGSDDRGAFYGLQSLRQLIVREDSQARVRGVQIRDWPDKQFRGIYLYLPGRSNIPFFKRFVRDYMALYKYNVLIMEMGASMRLDSHPELNAGWVEFARDCNYSARNYPPGPFHGLQQNSSHQDTADGGFLEKEEVADLARWIASHHIELVPELASFTHSYHLLTRNRELAAIPENKWPDIYCPSNAKSYSLVFEVYDEYVELLKPKMVHIGHDELFLPVGASAQCKDEDIGELFGEDVKQIHDHLASQGIRTALWGDMLLQSVRGRGLQKDVAADGWTYNKPGGMAPEQVERLIPKDCLIFNWFWSEDHDTAEAGQSEVNEATLDKLGFEQVYGNFDYTIKNYEARKKRATLLGGAPSAWFATNEIGFGKELMSTFLGCSNILWRGEILDDKYLAATVQSMIPAIRRRLSGVTPPSQTETSIKAVDIASRFNCRESAALVGMAGKVQYNNIPFDLKVVDGLHSIMVGTQGKGPRTGVPKVVTGIPIGAAPTSLIFLHACAKPAENRESFRLIWDQEDTADLLGWYEVVYEDGFVTTVPIRYGVNILEWGWARQNYCYGADALALGSSTFFVFEWINPRLGKVVEEVRLQGTNNFRGASGDFNNEWGPVIESNAILLRAISMVEKRA